MNDDTNGSAGNKPDTPTDAGSASSSGHSADLHPGAQQTSPPDTPSATSSASPYAVLEQLAKAMLEEQQANRRWRVFFRFATLFVALFAIWMAFDLKGSSKPVTARHTALVEIDGEIDSDSSTASVSSILPALNDAFSDVGSVGVILKKIGRAHV